MALSAPKTDSKLPILLLEPEAETPDEFRHVLGVLGRVEVFQDLATFLSRLSHDVEAIGLIDTAMLEDAPAAFIAHLAEFRGQRRVALVTSQPLESYISHLTKWGFTQSFSRHPPVHPLDLSHFLEMIVEPAAGFGLIRYLDATIEMYCLQVRTLEQKNEAIERVINHFATCGFDVHRLYNVRLILEETINNALFHAFLNATGEEKYTLADFDGLQEPGEVVKIEYGSDRRHLGFTVTDTAGTLSVPVILSKFERQLKSHGIFDQAGRGLYLSRLLTSTLIVNIEPHLRTQIVALFDERGDSLASKPFILNWAGPQPPITGYRDPDFDD